MDELQVELRGGVTNYLNTTRMNPSNLYEQYFCATSRMIKRHVINMVNDMGGPDVIDVDNVHGPFKLVLDGVKLFETEQYSTYLETTPEEQVSIVMDVYYKEAYIYYKASSKLKPYQVVANVQGTIYEPIKCKFSISRDGIAPPEESIKEVIFAPQYIILLAKTPEQYLATSSSKTNHFDLPVSVGPKLRQNVPYRNSPVKILSETETRLYRSYVGEKGIAELKDRANSVDTHRLKYRNILEAEQPTNIECLVDREQHPFGTDKSLELAETILNASGMELEYVKEK